MIFGSLVVDRFTVSFLYEFLDRDQLSEARAWTSLAEALAEAVAVRAALLAEVAGVALGAEVNGCGAPRFGCGQRCRIWPVFVSSALAALAASVVAGLAWATRW